MKPVHVFAAALLLGLLVGMVARQGVEMEGENYCSTLEAELQANESFPGAVACYSPRRDSGNLSNRTDLECVCRQSVNGSTRTFNVRRSR